MPPFKTAIQWIFVSKFPIFVSLLTFDAEFNSFQVAALLHDHPDLLGEFVHFLPDASATTSNHHASSMRNSVLRDGNSSIPPIQQVHFDMVLNVHAFHKFLFYSIVWPVFSLCA